MDPTSPSPSPDRILSLAQLASELKAELAADIDNNGGQASLAASRFWIVGAGVSAPIVPLASEIESECCEIAVKRGIPESAAAGSPAERYSYWFEKAFQNLDGRRRYLAGLIEKKPISMGNLRLGHLMQDARMPQLVVTPNFDTMLSQALSLFGKPPLVCDHPSTTHRILLQQERSQVVHVHGTFNFYDVVNLMDEMRQRSTGNKHAFSSMSSLLESILRDRYPLVVGYSGWEGDVIMTCLRDRVDSAYGSHLLPRNIYWCCYRRADMDSLPNWLKASPYVRFVLPTETSDRNESERPAFESGRPTLKSIPTRLTGSRPEFTLSAEDVFSELIRVLDVEGPLLYTDPLGAFVGQLEALFPSLGAGDSPEPSASYDPRSVVARVKRAMGSSEYLESRDISDRILEKIRQADYAGAITMAAANIDLLEARDLSESESLASQLLEVIRDETVPPEGAEAVCSWIASLTSRAISKGRESRRATELNVRALEGRGYALRELKRFDEEVQVWDEVVTRVGDITEPTLREQVAMALVNKGYALGQVSKSEEEIQVYDEVVARFGDATESSLREQVAMALVNKGVTLGQLERPEEEIQVYDEVVTRFGNATEPALREQVAMALVNKGITLGQVNRSEEEIQTYDEVVSRFGDATEPALREQVAMALVNKGITLGRVNKSEEAIQVYDDVVARFGDATEAALREQVAEALNGGAFRLLEIYGAGGRPDLSGLLGEAFRRALEANGYAPGKGSYNLACVEARRGNELECRRWLEDALAHQELLERGEIASDPDFESVRDAAWFQEFLGELPDPESE